MIIFRKHVVGLSHAALAKFVTRTSREVRLRGIVNVLVTSSRELCALNRRFRGKDKPTDVLSFVPHPSFVNELAGDIAISAEIAKQNARSPETATSAVFISTLLAPIVVTAWIFTMRYVWP